jgi:alpha-tubulin suppressor-like RCC1 family protein
MALSLNPSTKKKNTLKRHICRLVVLHLPLSCSLGLAQSNTPAPPLQPLPQPSPKCLVGMACATTDPKKLHTGVDYSVIPGTPVYAICDGEVHFDASKKSDIWDRFLIVKHDDCGGYKTLFGYYGHIDSLVGGKGTRVKKGQHIASVKEWPGQPKNTHLHFGISTKWFASGWGYQAGNPLGNGWLDPRTLLPTGNESKTQPIPEDASRAISISLIRNNRYTCSGLFAGTSCLALSPKTLIDEIMVRVPQSSPGRSESEQRNLGAFAALRSNGSVVTWGNPEYGGDSTSVRSSLNSGVVQLFSTNSAFAALRQDGSVVTWGSIKNGGNSSSVANQLKSQVIDISSTKSAFAALKADGSVITWGNPSEGGDPTVIAGIDRFNFELGETRTNLSRLRSGIVKILSTTTAFAALRADGSVVAWGDSSFGGDIYQGGGWNGNLQKGQLSSGVANIYSSGTAFAALKREGYLIAWGWPYGGADKVKRYNQLTSLSGISRVFSNRNSFAILMNNGSVVTSGGEYGEGSASVASDLQSNVVQIFSTENAFAALKTGGAVVTWGEPSFGGNSSFVRPLLLSDVKQVASTTWAFAALKHDGSVVTWGDSGFGGDSNSIKSKITTDVVEIFSTGSAFAALKRDGSVVTWGYPSAGGNSSEVAGLISSGVKHIFATNGAFAALRADGSVVTWGLKTAGGDSSKVIRDLNGVIILADPFLKRFLK